MANEVPVRVSRPATRKQYEISSYGRELTDRERSVIQRRNEQDELDRKRDEAIAADRAAYFRGAISSANASAQSKLMRDLNPLVLAGEMYAGEMAAAGAKGVARALTSGTMRPGFVRLPTGSMSEAAAEHGRRMAAKEIAASRAAQFRTIEGIQKRMTERESLRFIHEGSDVFGEVMPRGMVEGLNAETLDVAKETGRAFANSAKGRVVNSTAEAFKERAAKIAGEWSSEIGDMYRGAFSGAHGAVDWSKTFYSGLVRRSAEYVTDVAKKLGELPLSEIGKRAVKGTAKYASAPRLVHGVFTKVPGVRALVDKALPTMNPHVREAVLNTLTGVQDATLVGSFAYGTHRGNKERAVVEEKERRDRDLGYLKSSYDAYHTNSVYGTGMNADMDSAAWEKAAGQLMADRAKAMKFTDDGGIILPGKSPSRGSAGYIAHGHGDVSKMFDERMDALASLPGAKARMNRNLETLFGIMSNGVMTYSDAKALSEDKGATKESRARAKSMTDAAEAVFGEWTDSEKVFTDMDEFARQYLGGK